MSDNYTHKIVLFSKENFEGDALVIMWNLDNEGNHTFDTMSFRYKPYDTETECAFFAMSLICIKGIWKIPAFKNLVKTRLTLPNFNDYIRPNHQFRTLTPEKGDGTDQAKPQSYKSNNPNCFKMKFFPKYNSFIVSPVPDCFMDPEHSFRWVFRNWNELTIEYQPHTQLSNPYLEFGRHSPADRVAPILVKDAGGQWREPLYTYNLREDNNKIIFKNDETKDPEYWFFNFHCTIDKKHCAVDPEMQSGAGTGK